MVLGSDSTFVIDNKLFTLTSYGLLGSTSHEYLKEVINVMLEQSLIEIEMTSSTFGARPVLKIAAKGKAFLLGQDE